MTDRLDELTRDLFRAGRNEQPAAGAKRRILDAIHRREVPRRRLRPLWVAGGVLAIAAAWAIYSATTAPPETEPLSLRAEPTPPTPEPVTKTVPTPASAPSKTAAPVVPRPNLRGTTPTPSTQKPALKDELRLLEKARSEIRSGTPSAALATLDEYGRSMRGGAMFAEATLLRIEALARAGRTGEADLLARRFVEANPHSALSDRARQFVKSETGEPEP